MKNRIGLALIVAFVAVSSMAVVIGELEDTTPIMTLGEPKENVQLVSRSVFEAAVKTFSAGSDGSWIELNGSTGTIYSIVREIGVVGNKDKMIVSAVSFDYGGYGVPSLGAVFKVKAPVLPDFEWSGVVEQGFPYAAYVRSNKLGVAMSFQNQPFTFFSVEYDTPSDAPYTLLATGAASNGSLTLDWYGITTNSFKIATSSDLSAIASTANAAFDNSTNAIGIALSSKTYPDIATNLLYHIVVSNGHWLIKETQQ